jgi:hypothetical protein
MCRKYKLFFIFICLLSGTVYAQDYSNKGTDFWLGYGYHVNMAGNPANGGTQDMILYFTSDKNANVTVEALISSGTISGADSICSNASTLLTTNGDIGGNWSSSNNAVATVDALTGQVTGVSEGTVVITYAHPQPVSTIVLPNNTASISSPVIVPELAPTSELVPTPTLVPPPSQYKSKSPHKSRSPRKSRSPYESKSPRKSPRKSRSPEAIEVSRVSKRTPGSIRVIPIIYPSSGGRHNKTINKVYSSNRKTRRYKKH